MIIRLFLFITITELVYGQTHNPTVKVPHGILQGSWKVSTNGRNYANFQRIPYAQPPVGNNRFREPQPLQPWSGVWNATSAPPACLQYEPFQVTIKGTEDCLFLNVFTPHLNPRAMLPVMVYIHGGGFLFGDSAIYGAANLMDWDMVVVTLNYRLGLGLGFLSTGDDVVPGNNGLKDQLFALRWVKDNIKLFGGNPNSITLSGESAGGVSVHYHFLSPLSRGLFARGISYSGSAFCSWALDINPLKKSKMLASKAGCPTSNNTEFISCLRNKSGKDIINAQMAMFEWRIYLFSMFTPVVEALGVPGAFITECPFHATKAGRMMPVPLILTDVSEEGLYPAIAFQIDPSTLQELDANWDELASYIFIYNDTLPRHRRREVAQLIKKEYLRGQPVGQETFRLLVNALGDRLFFAHVGNLAHMHADNSGQPTYVSRYAYPGSWSITNPLARNNINYGVSHNDDVLRIFNVVGLNTTEPTERAMVKELIHIIYSFSVSGSPTLNNSKTVWLPVKPRSTELYYLDILSPYSTRMVIAKNFGNKKFWDQLGFNENANYNGRYFYGPNCDHSNPWSTRGQPCKAAETSGP